LFEIKSYIKRLEYLKLPPEEKKHFYKFFEKELLNIFAKDYYINKEELQLDFVKLKRSKSYKQLLEIILKSVEEEIGIKLKVDDLIRLTPNRFKLCSVCKKPFISFDNFNKMKICYKQDYIKYKLLTKSKDKTNKEFFKSTEKKSVCFMEYQNIINTAFYHNNKKGK
jgi:hypothetical protein